MIECRIKKLLTMLRLMVSHKILRLKLKRTVLYICIYMGVVVLKKKRVYGCLVHCLKNAMYLSLYTILIIKTIGMSDAVM